MGNYRRSRNEPILNSTQAIPDRIHKEYKPLVKYLLLPSSLNPIGNNEDRYYVEVMFHCDDERQRVVKPASARLTLTWLCNFDSILYVHRGTWVFSVFYCRQLDTCVFVSASALNNKRGICI